MKIDMQNKRLILLFICFYFKQVFNHDLSEVGDDELLQLIRTKEKLIVVFSKNNCEKCTQYYQHIVSLDEDFRKYMNAESVQVFNSHLVKLYSPNKEPAIVFFRHGIPLLYNGEANENEIYSFFERNQEPAVKELTDKTFEHITQAATGATTGDWLVMFYAASCVDCQHLYAVLEAVGANLKNRINVARVDADLGGIKTAKRFKVTKLPTMIFLRAGKYYKYDMPMTDVKSIIRFAEEWYKNVKMESVPTPESPFDELVNWSVEQIKFWIEFILDFLSRHPWVWKIGLGGFGLVLLTSIIALIKAERSRPIKDKKEKKEKQK